MKRCTILLALSLLCVDGEWASAQQSQYTQSQLQGLKNRNSAAGYSSSRIRSSVVNSAVPTYQFSQVNRGLLSNAIGGQRPQKPFSSINRGPSVTPYLGLLSENPFNSTATNYYSLVRPQLEQQRMNEKLQQQTQLMQRQLNAMAARAPYDPTGSENRAPTGHAAVYMNYGGYYTPTQPTSVRGR